MELVRQLKHINGIYADRAESIFVFTILEKIKEERLKLPEGSVTVL